MQVIYLDVATLACTPVTTISSAFGPVSTDGLDLLINGLLTALVLPDINKFIGGGFALPSIDGVALTSSSITPVAGSLQISTDISWNPSAVMAAAAAAQGAEEEKEAEQKQHEEEHKGKTEEDREHELYHE